MTDQQMRDLCARVLRISPGFEKACRFIADCADLNFLHVVRVCQGVKA